MGSVERICDAGNTVVFSKHGGYIMSENSGKKTEMKRERGMYTLTMWVQKKARPDNKRDDKLVGFVGLDEDAL